MSTARVVVASCLCALAALATPAAARAADSIWDAMRGPGVVVIVRHSYAPGTFDPPTARLDDCSTQRNLDERGKAQARRLGEAFLANGIQVDNVRSSPRCRCLDTAVFAFRRVEPWLALMGALNNSELRQRQLAEIRQAMAAHTGERPLVLVTHGSVVQDLTGLNVQMGAFVVMRRGVDGNHVVAGQLFVE